MIYIKNINQSIDFATKYSNKKMVFQSRITPLILEMKYDDVSVQPTNFSIGYPVYSGN